MHYHFRRWFSLQNNQLVYMKRSGSRDFSIMEEDLRLCTVKPAYESERRFCFEVLSPARFVVYALLSLRKEKAVAWEHTIVTHLWFLPFISLPECVCVCQSVTLQPCHRTIYIMRIYIKLGTHVIHD